MSEGLKLLQDLGAQKINEKTHIPRVPLQALLEEDFSSFNKIQLQGFISILQREYDVDLSSLKDKAILYINEQQAAQIKRESYVVPQNHSAKIIYIIIALCVLFGAIYYTAFYSFEKQVKSETINNTIIENVQKNIIPKEEELVVEIDASELNTTLELNATDVNETNLSEVVEEIVPELVVDNSLVVNLKSRRWFGYINLFSHKKKSKTFSGKFEFDTSKDWIFVSRPGKIEIEINSEIQKFSSNQNMRFKYIDGELSKITLEEWRNLNKGRTW